MKRVNKQKSRISTRVALAICMAGALLTVSSYSLTIAAKGTNLLEVDKCTNMLVASAKGDTQSSSDSNTEAPKASLPNFSSDYAAIGYDTEDGLESAEINAVAQTSDGYIWAGTYSGMYRYDGYRFEKIQLDERINNVMQMFVDSKNHLWIGTNDSGIACYEPESGNITFYTTAEGLPSNAIRAICEDKSGNIYVGTTSQLCIISPDGKIKEFLGDQIYSVRTLSVSGDIIVGVTNGGELFFIKNGKLLAMRSMENENNVYYAAAAMNDKGIVLVGTSSDYALKFLLSENGSLKTLKQIHTNGISYFNKLLYSPENDGYFFCCENGLGFIGNNDKITDMSADGFNSSVSDVFIDYQDNMWFASNKQGVERYSLNPFVNIFARAKVDESVVNSLLIKNNFLYVGMDNGLIAIDLDTDEQISYMNERKFEGVRVRHLMLDSAGNIWASTYGQDGLMVLGKDGSFKAYNENTENIVGSRFRSTLELADGQILAASSTGLNYIDNGKVVKTISEDDGLGTQILSMVQADDGKIIAGSDGNGVYIIEDGKIIDTIDEDDGLGSLVVLKVVPCKGGYILVTSNSLYYYTGRAVTKLNAFPYSNNYDVYISKTGEAWVTSSAGIFVVDEDALLKNENYSYTLLNRSRGFYTTLTANAKNAVKGDDLYLCCTDGVRKISLTDYNSFDNDYEIRVSRVLADDEIIHEESGTYRIPAIQGRIEFDVAVLNFTLSNPLLKIFLEGAKDEGITCLQNEMSSLVYTNLPYGNYKLHVQVLDSGDRSIIRDEVYDVVKDSQLYERTYFKVILFILGVLLVAFIGWVIRRIIQAIKNARTWKLEATTDPMTGLLNKAASKRELTELCKTKQGILMMIDLDSFKLVNDLYGHDMGDKILIRFADIIRSCIRETDIAGRMGGDEFIAYIMGTNDESVVASKAEHINEEIVKSAKEFMGEDMTIPLGASIGAVCAPNEGTDFEELFGLADKALYNVKQNGKHGYAMYRKSNPKLTTEEDSIAKGIAGTRKILGERNEGKGAFKVDFNKLQAIYRTFDRLSRRTNAKVTIVQFTLNAEEGKELSDEIMDQFFSILSGTLRSNDVVAPTGKNQAVALLTNIEGEDQLVPIDRVVKTWDDAPGHEGFSVSYELEAM
ncbi:diguanylate cyclase [Butyrivibrio sp. INlla16]|uniref:ligand-binding sensor domain-containing protein n=1 Tax=Butyrivibrio sp. INlla16 TaxID=1520807 RepID=UPI000888C5A5|nr:ligand-binding sensor domain-containing diguanylate cyclase [Butyrivibrio sp. INlla16]SDB06088.1 diguanylate cyclase (GGDEF) domain-containing protein [Butyrivibrio sp. INlla16]